MGAIEEALYDSRCMTGGELFCVGEQTFSSEVRSLFSYMCHPR